MSSLRIFFSTDQRELSATKNPTALSKKGTTSDTARTTQATSNTKFLTIASAFSVFCNSPADLPRVDALRRAAANWSNVTIKYAPAAKRDTKVFGTKATTHAETKVAKWVTFALKGFSLISLVAMWDSLFAPLVRTLTLLTIAAVVGDQITLLSLSPEISKN